MPATVGSTYTHGTTIVKHALSKLLSNDEADRELSSTAAETNANSHVLQQALSARADDRLSAARPLGSLQRSRNFHVLLRLLNDVEPSVHRAALAAVGYTDRASLARELVQAAEDIEFRRSAIAVLVALGMAAVPTIVRYFPFANKRTRIRLVRVLAKNSQRPVMAGSSRSARRFFNRVDSTAGMLVSP